MRPLSSKSFRPTVCPPSPFSTTIALNAPMLCSRWDLRRRESPRRRQPPAEGLRFLALDRALLDRQVDRGGGDAERDREPPHEVVAAIGLVQHAAEVDAEEAADLV